MSGLEGLLVAVPLLWLTAVSVQQTRRWLALRRPPDWREGEARAQAMLREVLTAEEYGKLTAEGYLDLPSKLVAQRFYRVYWGPRLVEVFERGRRIQALCVQSTRYLPPSDRILMHKLLLEGDEHRYLRLANVSRLGRLQFPPRTLPENLQPPVRIIQ